MELQTKHYIVGGLLISALFIYYYLDEIQEHHLKNLQLVGGGIHSLNFFTCLAKL
ncbi:MAG: hypothetical protein GBAus27B_000309 [Mycoplasmataceae bacterium]|nr:MAG: hypothetical protein GBAus27B_000309 [Mycoplasmataceae bacterium]